MAIGDIIKEKDIHTYRLLQKMKQEPKKAKNKLGDSVTNLMKANSYKRVNGAIRQTRWE